MYYTNEQFNEMLQQPSPVEWRRLEFENKFQNFLNEPDLSDMLIRDGKINYPFIIVGMTIKGKILSGTGFNAFVANGYPPSGIGFPSRNLEAVPSAKFVFTKCCAVKKRGDNYTLIPVLNDEEVLNLDIVEPLFEKIISEEYQGRLLYSTELSRFKIKDNNCELFAWECAFCTNIRKINYILADADNACIYILSAEQMERYRIINETGDRVCSPYSAYLFNGRRLFREEYQRLGGWGQFHG